MMKFTNSRDGKQRVTIQVKARIERGVFDWLVERVGDKKAEKVIRDSVYDFGPTNLDWRVPAFKDGVIEVIHVDDMNRYQNDGWDVFEGNW